MKYQVKIPDFLWYRTNVLCMEACPVHTDSGKYVQLIGKGLDLEAYLVARSSNPFASVCGRICAAPCEDACRRGKIDESITIRALKRFVAEKYGLESKLAHTQDALIQGEIIPRGSQWPLHAPSVVKKGKAGTRQKAAIIGGGPTGLACAHDLALRGYQVTIFEALNVLGGMPRTAIPEYRLPKDILRKESEFVLSLGVEIKFHSPLSSDFGLRQLKEMGYKDEAGLIQINCNICHRRDGETSGMEMINLAKKLMTRKKNCQTCHAIDGKGGKQGADLTFVGDKPSERFDFSKIEEKLIAAGKPLSMLSWHFGHFMDPSAVVPESKMPKMDYSEQEAWALTMLMMSWKNFKLPVMLIPKKAAEPLSPGSEEPASAISSPAARGKILYESQGCSDCHTIGKGVEIGPDLLGVSERREANWLKKMIRTPEEMEKADPTAKKIYREYKEVGMPNADLSEEDAEMIINTLNRSRKDSRNLRLSL